MNNLAQDENPSSLNLAGSVPGKKEILLIAALGIVFTALCAIFLGKDVGWDQKNYHHYTVYAWMKGLMNYDLAPAGMQSWLNPLVYVPHYWLVNHLPPVVVGGILGAWAGLNFVLIYLLARLVLLRCAPWLAVGIAFACGAVGFADPLFWEIVGVTEADNLLSPPILVSLCALYWAGHPGISEKAQNRAYALAGMLMGAACGLKWTCFVYALGLTVTLLVLWSVLRLNRWRFLFFAVGGVLGFLATGGYWSWILWTHYRNPFFPYWNRIFRSPWAVISNFRDMRFPPPSVEAAITYPFQWFLGLHPSSEAPFRDARYAVLSVLIFLIAAAVIGQCIARLWGHRAESAPAAPLVVRKHLWLLLTFAVTSYGAWIKTFAIQRYLIPLSLISGLLLLLALDWLIASRITKLSAFFFLALFCLLWMRVEVAVWRVPYGSDWFGVELAPEVQSPGTLFIMLGGGPMSYIVPFLPESTRTVRLMYPMIPESETKLVSRAREIISQHSGPIRSLAMEPLTEADFSYLKRFGLALAEQECVEFRSAVDQFTSCRVVRQAQSEPRP